MKIEISRNDQEELFDRIIKGGKERMLKEVKRFEDVQIADVKFKLHENNARFYKIEERINVLEKKLFGVGI